MCHRANLSDRLIHRSASSKPASARERTPPFGNSSAVSYLLFSLSEKSTLFIEYWRTNKLFKTTIHSCLPSQLIPISTAWANNIFNCWGECRDLTQVRPYGSHRTWLTEVPICIVMRAQRLQWRWAEGHKSWPCMWCYLVSRALHTSSSIIAKESD